MNIVDRIDGWKVSLNSQAISMAHEAKNTVFSLLNTELSNLRQQIIEDAKEYLGSVSIKYQRPDCWMDENGFDCSGFITFLLSRHGLSISWIRHTNEYLDGFWVFVQNPIPWDLIFFSRNGLYPTHIWICIWENKYIHAPGKDGTTIEMAEIQDEPIVWTEGNLLYSSNPIWFKRISLVIDDENFRRWNKVV